MKIPNFPDDNIGELKKGFNLGGMGMMDKRNVKLSQIWKDTLEQLFNELQKNMSDEGYILPHLTTAQITELNIPKYIGALVYDTDTNKANVNINGTFKEILTT